jgi:hypothetical protein
MVAVLNKTSTSSHLFYLTFCCSAWKAWRWQRPGLNLVVIEDQNAKKVALKLCLVPPDLASPKKPLISLLITVRA